MNHKKITKYWRKFFHFFSTSREKLNKKKQKNALINGGRQRKKEEKNIIISCIVAGLMKKNIIKKKSKRNIYENKRKLCCLWDEKEKPFSSFSFLFHFFTFFFSVLFFGIGKIKKKTSFLSRVQKKMRKNEKSFSSVLLSLKKDPVVWKINILFLQLLKENIFKRKYAASIGMGEKW